MQRHVGGQLTPPASLERWQELSRWEARTVVVEGSTWERSTVDVAIAGLGWIAVRRGGGASRLPRLSCKTHWGSQGEKPRAKFDPPYSANSPELVLPSA